MTNEQEKAEELAEYVRIMGGYLFVRVLPDGSVAAVGDLLYTRAIFLGCNVFGFERRFCFADRALALQRFDELQSENDTPEGWTARRPETLEDIERKSKP